MAEKQTDDITEIKGSTNNQESFRDKVATIDESGKRVWIYPRKPSGPFYRARTIVSIFLLAFLFGAP
ncbi:MAG: hypothetical protein D6732_27525, partial [Methanobacteriota archaeon]